MSIFDTGVMESTVGMIPASQEYVEPTLEGVQTIIMESAQQAMALEGAMYVSDIAFSNQVVHESANLETVLEGFAGNTMNKLKQIWQKLWAKVQGWFKAVIKRVNLIFTSGGKFVDQYGKELREKSAVGFEYKGHKYAADVETPYANLSNKLESSFRDVFKIASDITNANAGDVLSNSFAKGGASEQNAADIINKATKDATGEEGLTPALQKIHTDVAGEETVEIVNFSNVSVDTMLKTIKESKKSVATLNRAKSEMDDKFKKVIATIEKAAKKVATDAGRTTDTDTSEQKVAKNESSSKMTTYFNKVVSILQQVVNAMLTTQGALIKTVEKRAAEYQSVLKKFATFKGKKPVKESTADDEDLDEEDDAALESAMNLFL